MEGFLKIPASEAYLASRLFGR